MVYTVSTRNYLGNHITIVSRDDDGNEMPVLNIMPSHVDFPGDLQKLAANLASLLNGHEPLYKIPVGPNSMYWQRTPYGIELRLQETRSHV